MLRAGADDAASLIDLSSLDESAPERFYLPDDCCAQLADCYAVVEGARLPLHGAVLALQSAVLRQLLVQFRGPCADGAAASQARQGVGCCIWDGASWGGQPGRQRTSAALAFSHAMAWHGRPYATQPVFVPTGLPLLPPPAPLPQEPLALSSTFAGCSLKETACFLRLVYRPDHATPASLAALHKACGGLLPALVHLAHRLDAAALLAKLEACLQGE